MEFGKIIDTAKKYDEYQNFYSHFKVEKLYKSKLYTKININQI